MKDLRFSPSVMLAEYLHKEDIKVYVHDDSFSSDEILDILPYCEFIDIYTKSINTDVAIMMSLSKDYKFFTQKNIDEIGLSKVRYILDNTDFFKNFKYSSSTLYHRLCDENLEKVIN